MGTMSMTDSPQQRWREMAKHTGNSLGSDALREAADLVDKLEDQRREYSAGVVPKGRHMDLLAERDRLQYAVDTLFQAIRHGDEQHQVWLELRIADHFAKALESK